MFKRKQEEERLKSIRLQLEFLDVLRNRHLAWANDADDSTIAQIHIEITELIVQVKGKYNHLLDMYNQRTHT